MKEKYGIDIENEPFNERADNLIVNGSLIDKVFTYFLTLLYYHNPKLEI